MTWFAALLFASVQVSAEQCDTLEVAEVQRIVEVELSAAPPTAEPIVARLACSGTSVRTEVSDPVTHKTLSRTVSVRGLRVKGQARALALAIAELISASWSELLLVPRKPPEDARVDLSAPPPEVAAQAVAALPPLSLRDTLRLEAVGAARVLPTSDAVQWGGGARFLWASPARLGLLVDVLLEHADTPRPNGRLAIDTVSGSAGPLMLFRPASWLQLHAAVVGRFGAARIIGTPNDELVVAGSTLSGGWGGPALVLGASARLGPVATGLSAEGGWSLLRLTALADGVRTAGLDGPWVGLSLHVGWAR